MSKHGSGWWEPDAESRLAVWADEQLKRHQIHRLGDLDRHHTRPWSKVLRVPTDQGDFFLKALPENLRYEVAVVAGLADRFPGRVPRLLAADPVRGWMLQFDEGALLRRELKRTSNTELWNSVLSTYASMQVSMAGEDELLRGWKVPDRRPETLVPKIRALIENRAALHLDHPQGLQSGALARLEQALGPLTELCEGLSQGPVPSSLNHGDLHDGNVFVRDGECVIFDWGDSSVSHPFFSLRTVHVSLESRPGWEENDRRFRALDEHYLTFWADYASPGELRRAMRQARIVAPMISALSWHRALANVDPNQDEFVRPVPRLLEEFLANLDGGGRR